MKWKDLYKLTIATIGLILSRKIYLLFKYSASSIFNISTIISFIPFFVYLLYVQTLNKCIEKNKTSKILKNIEYASYVFLIIESFFLLQNIFFIFLNLSQIEFSWWHSLTIIRILFIVLMIKSFILRKKTLGKFNKEKELISDLDSLNSKDFKTNHERLELCQLCTKKEFNPNIGIVCSITHAKPLFVTKCSDFDKDSKAYEKRITQLSENEKSNKKKPIWAYIVSGIILIRIIFKLVRWLQL